MMKLLGREIKIFARDSKKTTKKTNVLQYPASTQGQSFTQYQSIQGSSQLSFDLIDDLYSRTIMNRVIQKIAGDATRMNYSVNCIDSDGKRNKEIELVLRKVDSKLTRSNLRAIFRDMLKYGTSFLYTGYGAEGIPERMYPIDSRYIKPIIEKGELVRWEYSSQGTPIPLNIDELIHFPLDPDTGEIFGNSIFGPVIKILELLLNSEINSALLLDRFSQPFYQWTIAKGEKEAFATPEEIITFMDFMITQAQQGYDLGTNEGVTVNPIGTDSNMWDFVPAIQHLMYTFGVIVGTPLAMIGYQGDNLSVSKVQMASYQSYLTDLEEMIGDQLIEKLYKPYLEKMGFIEFEDYIELYISWPIFSIEEGSKSIQAIAGATNLGLIDRDEGRSWIGHKGRAIPIDEMDVPNVQHEVTRNKPPTDPQADPDKTKKNPDGDPGNRDHDPNG